MVLYTSDSATRLIDELYNNDPELNYEELMRHFRGLLGEWGVKRLKHNRIVQDQVTEIKRRAMVRSLQGIARQNPHIHFSYILKSYPWMEKATRQLYTRNNGKSPLQLLAEDAGVTFVPQTTRVWTLKRLLDEYTDHSSVAYEQAAHRHLRGTGKIAILKGIDFLRRPRVGSKGRAFFTFSEKEMRNLMEDDSINDDEKAGCVFNALTFQHYTLNLDHCIITRQLNDDHDGFAQLQATQYLDGRLELEVAQHTEDYSHFRVLVRLSDAGHSSNTGFYFLGDWAGHAAIRFYHDAIGSLCGVLKSEDLEALTQ